MKKFCEFLREPAIEMINLKKKKIKLITKEQHENAKICYICKEKLENEYLDDKTYRNVWDYCHYTGEYTGAAHRHGLQNTRPYFKIHVIFLRPKLRGQFSENLELWIYEFLFNSVDRISNEKKNSENRKFKKWQKFSTDSLFF